jgi:hypothetical protein
LTLHSRTDQESKKKEWNEVAWHSAEHNLMGTEADVLAIFDCCDAGSLAHFRAPIRFEYLGACSIGQTTPPPGPDSFTSALIWALEQLKDKDFFPTSELQQMIPRYEQWPKGQAPPLCCRFHPSPDYIFIAPQGEESIDDSSTVSTLPAQPSFQDFLDLRFHFTEKIGQKGLINVATKLSGLVRMGDIGASSITPLGMLSELEHDLSDYVHPIYTAQKAGRHWREQTVKNRPNKTASITPLTTEAVLLGIGSPDVAVPHPTPGPSSGHRSVQTSRTTTPSLLGDTPRRSSRLQQSQSWEGEDDEVISPPSKKRRRG